MASKKILAIGVDVAIFKILKDMDSNLIIDSVEGQQKFEELITAEPDPEYLFVMTGNLVNYVSPAEMAQAMRGVYSDKKIYYVMNQMENYERKNLVKNGFDDVFVLPTDHKFFLEAINEYLSADLKAADLRPVRLADISPETILDFNIFIFFPKNNKYIKYAAAGYKIEPSRLERLKNRNLGVIFVPKKEMKSFYKDTAKKLKNIVEIKGMSKTEAYEKAQTFVRDTFSNIFDKNIATDFESGKQLLEDCRNIVSHFVSDTDGPSSFYEKLNESIGLDHSDVYSHSMNVSVFASLFAIGLGYKNIEDFAIAGLFHDLGLAGASDDLEERDLASLGEDEKKIYHAHPEKTIEILKDKRMIISPLVQKMILQHHENYDGSGFPSAYSGDKICPEAQILQLASLFDVLTRYTRGSSRLSPEQFAEKIKGDRKYNPEVTFKLHKLLSNKSA